MEPDRRQDVPREPEAIGHPRPLLRREDWWSLDGEWDFAVDGDGRWHHPDDVDFDRTITVPFAPETPASGVGLEGFVSRCWYRRQLKAPPARRQGERLVLHFGAVDYAATVWIDGRMVTEHAGGYSPFAVDVTRELADGAAHVLSVRAEDDPLDLSKPRGKQDWELEPHSIWYPRTTGIWQTVWVERLPAVSVSGVQWAADLSRTEVEMDVTLVGEIPPGLGLRIRLEAGGRLLVDDVITVMASRFSRGFRLDATGVDQLRDALVWTPNNPVLVDAVLELVDGTGCVDRVYSYTAIRTVGTRAGRFLLNGRPWPLRLVLDQGYWPDTGLTPPSDDALRRDVELAKAMGFNGVRKHQKIEDPRFLHWADRLGLMVWYECPPAYRFDSQAVRRVTEEWTAAIERDRSHPCIVAWVPFNESSGLLGIADRQDQQDFVTGLTLLTKAMDPTRPVVSNDGWESVGGDIIGIHDYDQDPAALVARWSGDLREVLLGYGAHGRLHTLDEDDVTLATGTSRRPVMLTEIGGIGWAPGAPVDRTAPGQADRPDDRLSQPAAWGYSTVGSSDELAERYQSLLSAVHSIEQLAGFCYTQFADTYQEVNGLLHADRTPKLPLEVVAAATRGRGKSFYDPLGA